eukprot:TRINITY_DN460_c2_g1_i1.p1 TRINITY_DN460_c2_g1~~TRINITY_DN460_c2_g1_i1.p1  ORF type:complete len:210 (+),score=66.08 TRINITY_DN460_c2_g1_i1:24-653(+)
MTLYIFGREEYQVKQAFSHLMKSTEVIDSTAYDFDDSEKVPGQKISKIFKLIDKENLTSHIDMTGFFIGVFRIPNDATDDLEYSKNSIDQVIENLISFTKENFPDKKVTFVPFTLNKLNDSVRNQTISAFNNQKNLTINSYQHLFFLDFSDSSSRENLLVHFSKTEDELDELDKDKNDKNDKSNHNNNEDLTDISRREVHSGKGCCILF